MVYVYAFVAIILLIILLFLLLPAGIRISYGKSKNADIELKFLWGLVKIPLKPKAKKDKAEKTKQSDTPEEKDKSFFEGLNNISRIIKIINKTYSKSREYVYKRMKADVTVNITFGLYDAALTGIATGAIWTLLYEILGLISTSALIQKHSFNVDPVFDKALFEADGLCVFKFIPVNVIGILIHILKNYNKVKAEIENVNTH